MNIGLCEKNKQTNLQAIDTDEGEEFQLYGIYQTFNKIIEENVPKLRKDISIHICT